MATWKPSNLITKGVTDAFHQAVETTPTIYQNHCTMVNSQTKIEPHAFPGFLPVPREFIDGRLIQGLRDFSLNITNKTYEMTFAIDRSHFEDDQTGTISQRIQECAEVWATYKDYLFTTMLTNGNVAGNTAFDGVVFHGDTRTIGGSANIDNNLTAAAATTTVPTAAEFVTLGLQDCRATGMLYQDDQGRPFNVVAAKQVRVIIPPAYEAAASQAKNSTLITTNDYGNEIRGWFDYDVDPYLTGITEMWVSFTGSVRKGFIYQQRTPLEVIVDQEPTHVAKEDAIIVMCRERFVFAYGDPRRNILFTWS
jgi:phage major head subunit gpT-like protein